MDTIDNLRASIATPDCPDFAPMPHGISHQKDVAQIAGHMSNGAAAVANYRQARAELEDLCKQRPRADQLAMANSNLWENLDDVRSSMNGAYREIQKWRKKPWEEPQEEFFDGVTRAIDLQSYAINKKGGIKDELEENDKVIELMRFHERDQSTERRLNPSHSRRRNQNHPGSTAGYSPTPGRVIYETPWPAGRSNHGQIGFTGRHEGDRPSRDTSFPNPRLPNIAQPGDRGMGYGFGQAGPSVGGGFGPHSRNPSWDYNPQLTAMADEIRYDTRTPTPPPSPPSQRGPRIPPRHF